MIVRFVLSGEYEWYNKNLPNVLVRNYKKLHLALASYPLIRLKDRNAVDNIVVTRWFVKGKSGWEVHVFEYQCYGCGNP